MTSAAGGGGAGTKELSYGATYKAYTESGEAHFNTYVDGLRELLDNSVEYALQGNERGDEDPEIKLVISLTGQADQHTVAVGDNGRGMNETQLHEFLKYFKTQQDRGIQSEMGFEKTHNDNAIGMYGIGAKEAVFFLADGVEVITKHQDDRTWRSVSMSKRRFEQRARDGVPDDQVLKDTMRFRPWEFGEAPIPEDLPAEVRECKPVQELLNCYMCAEHYNIMVLPRFEHGSRLNGEDDVQRLARELANTYAYAMLPDQYDQLFAHTMSRSQSHKHVKGVKIELIFQSDTYTTTISLNDLVENGDCYMGSLLLQAKFSDYVKCFEGTYHQRRRETEALRESGESPVETLDIKGVLVYFPFDSDRETRPVWGDESNESCDTKTNPILVFWKNRLVPHDLLKDLCFLQPKSHSNVHEFRHRCCGLLFFPKGMRISRNKMNLMTDKQSLYDALLPLTDDDTTANSGNCVWKRDLTNNAVSWLKKMHSKHDKEIQFSNPSVISCVAQRSGDSEELRVTKWVQACCDSSQREKLGQSPTFTAFQKATFSSESKLVVKVGDKVKVRTRHVEYGVVQEIVAQGRQSDGYRGQGWFLLKRFPEEIYREDPRGYSMNRLTKGPGNGKVSEDEWEGEMEKQSAHLPTRLKLFHWAKPDKRTGKVDFSNPGKPYKVPASPIEIQVKDVEAFQNNLDFTVQIFGADRKSEPMSSINETKLKVTCRITAEATDETTDDGIKTLPTKQAPRNYVCDLPTKDCNHQYFFGSSRNSYEHRASAFLKDWVTAAVYSVTFVVTDSSQKVYQVEAPTVKFKVRAGPVTGIFLYDKVGNPWATGKKQLQLGKECPDSLKLQLEDDDGNTVAIPADLPEIRFVVKAEPAYKSKTGKDVDDPTPDKSQKGKDADLEKVFAVHCVSEKDPEDDQIVVLKNVVLDTKGKLHPKLSGRVNEGKDRDDFKPGKASKVLGAPRKDGRQWRKATFTVLMKFDHGWVESEDPIKVNVLPGAPNAVALTDIPPDIQSLAVNNGDTLRRFSVQLVDHVGINAYTLRREDHVCRVRADHDVFADDADLEVKFTAKGTAEFKRIVTHITDPSLFNKRIDLIFDCKGVDFSEPGTEMEELRGLLSMKVAPSNRPSKIEVWHNDTGAIGGEDGDNFTEEVGVKLTDLTLMLFDESGNKIELPKGTTISPNWATNQKTTCTTSKLPALKLPDKPGEEVYSVRIKLPGKTHPIDDYVFKVTVVPGQATQWKMEFRERKREIRCGVEKDLHNALEVYAADQCGNRARVDSDEDSTIKPTLAVNGAALTASVPESRKASELGLRPIRERRISGGGDMNGYKLAPKYEMGPKARLDGKVGQCEVTVCDAGGRLRACTGTVDLVPGEPTRIVLESDIFDDVEAGVEQLENMKYSAHVPAKFKLEDLVAKIVDTGGNIVAIDTPLTLKSTADSVVTISRIGKIRAKKGCYKFPSIDLSAGTSAKSYTLEVDGNQQFLPNSSAQIVCNVVLSNAVVDINFALSVESAICGQPLKAGLEIEILTEDGHKFVPSADSLECELKKKQERQARPSQQHKTAVPVFELFDGGASVKDSLWMLDDVGGDATPFVPEQAGLHQIVCTYTELRAGMQARKPLKFTEQFPILPGAAVKLVCSNNRSTVNANNGRDPRGRGLMKIKINPVDKYGNHSTFPDDCSVRAMLVGIDGTDQTKWPALEDSEDSGVHKGCVVQPATNKDIGKHQRVGIVTFDLRLKEGVGETEGVYDLKFTVVPNVKDKKPAADDVESLIAHVNFTPDGIRSKEIEDKQAQLEDLLAERTDLENTFEQADETFSDLKKDMKAKAENVRDLLSKLAQAGNVWAQKDLNACKNTPDQEGVAASVKKVLSSDICEQITMHAESTLEELDQEKPRAAKIRPRKRMEAIKTLGRPLVELGFVDDADLAHTLSWAAGPAVMDSFIASDSKRQKELYEVHKCNAFAEDQLDVYRDRQGARSLEHRQRAALPLQLPLSHQAGNWPKDRPEPVFLVNLIQLPPNTEHYRDTIFWRAFKSAILVSTLDEAMHYRRECKKHGKAVATIFTRDGHISGGGGFLQAGTERPSIDRLANVFGALGKKMKTRKELDDLKRLALALYDDHSQLEVAHKALNSATAKVEDRMQSLQTEIEQLEHDIAELKRSRKRGSSGGFNRPAQKPRTK